MLIINDIQTFKVLPIYYFSRGKYATFGTCLALISTKNRLKSLEDAKSEASKIAEIQPFSHFTKSC